MSKIRTVDLESAVKNILDKYCLECTEDTKAAVKEVTKMGAKKVRANAQASFNGHRYASGWTSKVETGRLSAQGVIYNSKLPGLPHLLEHGHAKVVGGRRYSGSVSGREHIASVERELEEFFERELERRLRS